MANVKNRYPLSTSDGQSIPLDVVRPYSCIFWDIVTISATAAIDIPEEVDMFQIISDQDLIMQFASSAASAAAPVSGTAVVDAIFIPKSTLTTVSPPIDKKSFSLRALTTTGVALINFLETWSALSLQSQITRR